jgi:signal transduction histidine kinase
MTKSVTEGPGTDVTESPEHRLGAEGAEGRLRPARAGAGVPVLPAGLVLLAGAVVTALYRERTRRRMAEAQAGALLATLTRLNRRAVVEQLSASLTHQLGQPLAAILRNAEAARILMASTPSSDPRIKEIIDEIHRGDLRAIQIIGSMRTLLKDRDVQRAAVDINQLAQETVKLVAADADQRRVEVDLQTSGDPLIVAGDRVPLEQVLLNLIMNSLEALSAANTPVKRLAVRTSGDNGRVMVSVSDTGSGIPETLVGRVFEPFFTTKPDGMGVGLSIARSIIEAHHGGITAEHNPHGGAVLRFWLPRLQGEAEAAHGHGVDSVIPEGRRPPG